MDTAPVARGRDIALAGGDPQGVRKQIRESWHRARSNGLRPDRHLPPVAVPEHEIDDFRREHALARVWPLLADTLRAATSEPGTLLFLADSDGQLLWTDGRHPDLAVAERVNLIPGALWSERGAGTNGIGTALALARPFQVTGAEHYLSAITGFTCAAAPIRDPFTGRPVGVIDLTFGARESRSMALSLLITTARLAEAELRAISLREHANLRSRYAERLARHSGTQSALVTADGQILRADPPGWLPPHPGPLSSEGSVVLPTGQTVLAERLAPGGPFLLVAQRTGADDALAFEGLGRDRAQLHVAGVTHDLSKRHSELVAVLLANPGGLNAEELAHEVYGPSGKPVTLRAEIARVRSLLGHRLASEPYRLTGEYHADFLRLDADLSAEPPDALLDRYPGPLLPGSSAPGVAGLRGRLHHRLRDRLLRDGDADALRRWLAARHGRDDAGVGQALSLAEAGGDGTGRVDGEPGLGPSS